MKSTDPPPINSFTNRTKAKAGAACLLIDELEKITLMLRDEWKQVELMLLAAASDEGIASYVGDRDEGEYDG